MAKQFESVINRLGLNTANLTFETRTQLPRGYSCWLVPRVQRDPNGGTYEDKYVAGHPSGGLFLSFVAFLDHFCWLQFYGLAKGCSCCLCTGKKREKSEGLRTPAPTFKPVLQVVVLPPVGAAAPPSANIATLAAPVTGTLPVALPIFTATAVPAAATAAASNSAAQEMMELDEDDFDEILPPNPLDEIPKVTATAYDAEQSSLMSDEERTNAFQHKDFRGQEPGKQFNILSPDDDIEEIKKHASIALEQVELGDGVELFTAEEMMAIDWEYFEGESLPSYGTGIYEAAGVGGRSRLAERLYARLREHS